MCCSDRGNAVTAFDQRHQVVKDGQQNYSAGRDMNFGNFGAAAKEAVKAGIGIAELTVFTVFVPFILPALGLWRVLSRVFGLSWGWLAGMAVLSVELSFIWCQ